jgi:hypothetical protein
VGPGSLLLPQAAAATARAARPSILSCFIIWFAPWSVSLLR